MNQQDLSAKASDAMSFVCSDLQVLHREMTKTNPVGAMTVLSLLGKATALEQEISQLCTLIKRGK